MTTKVTVDAHAGWPVEVKSMRTDGTETVDVVNPNEVRDFYVHTGQEIHVRELVKDANGETLPDTNE